VPSTGCLEAAVHGSTPNGASGEVTLAGLVGRHERGRVRVDPCATGEQSEALAALLPEFSPAQVPSADGTAVDRGQMIDRGEEMGALSVTRIVRGWRPVAPCPAALDDHNGDLHQIFQPRASFQGRNLHDAITERTGWRLRRPLTGTVRRIWR
jgi:hypothetical protein